MDSYEATKTVFSRLQSLDPEYASKTMGYILLQDEGEKEMIRLAFGTENQLLTVINKAKTELPNLSNGSSSTSAVSTAGAPHPSFSSLSNPIPISRPTPLSLPLSSPRLTNAGLFNPPSPSSPSLWSMAPAGSNHHGHGPTHLFSPPSGNPSSMSYAAAVNGNSNNGTHNGRSFPLGFGNTRENFVDDYHLRDQSFNFVNDPLTLQSPKDVDYFDQSSLDFVPSPSCRSDSVLYPYLENNSNGVENHGGNFHRRSCSVNDVCFGMDDSSSPGGTGFKSCLYYNRGFCKNGSSCKFVHGGGDSCGDGSTPPPIGSPYKFDAFDQCQQELIRSKIALQQRLAAAQLMGGMNLPYNKLNFLQSEAAQRSAMLMGEDFHKLSRSSCRSPRNEFSGFGGGDDSGSSSRQIYLTFPADSTFREEDVSNYFSNYGPVQDVRIPYQQKRMFGFVTFLYPETVRRILAKGNPHFVCDSRVLVKPYKEKSKLPDKKQQQHNMERGEFSSCTSPSGLDLREPFEIQIGPRMFYNTQEMLYRKKLEEQADLQQALELQGRRMQLLELKNQHHLQQNMHVGSPLSSPHMSHAALSQTAPGPQSNGFIHDNNASSEEGKEHAVIEKDVKKEVVNAVAAVTERNGSCGDDGGANDGLKKEEYDLGESFEHILPDNLFASPTKSGGENRAVFSSAALVEAIDVAANATSAAANIDTLVTTATMTSGGLSMATPLKSSCFLEMPRFSSGHGAVGM